MDSKARCQITPEEKGRCIDTLANDITKGDAAARKVLNNISESGSAKWWVYQEKAAKTFRKKYGLLNPHLDDMKNIIRFQGHSIVEFNAIFNDEDAA